MKSRLTRGSSRSQKKFEVLGPQRGERASSAHSESPDSNWRLRMTCRKVNLAIALPWYTFCVTTFALHEVNVMRTVARLERCIHLLDVQAAIRETRMTGRTRRAGELAVVQMASEAAQAFMNPDRRAVVA